MQQNDNRPLRATAVPAARLRERLAGRGALLAPETPDGLMGRMVALAGFELAFVGLMGTALNRIGSPDAGLVTASELVDNATRAMQASGLPAVVDIGTGFGNALNVRRTVAELQRQGVAGILLRDGEDPPAFRNATRQVPAADMAAKLRAAADVRQESGGDFVLIAGIEGAGHATSLAEVARRAALYREAGADLIHVGSLPTRQRAAAVAGELKGIALTCSLVAESELDADALGELGYAIAFVPHCGLMAAVPAIEHTFNELARAGSVGHIRPHIASWRQFTDIAGLPQVSQLEARYGVPDEQRITL
jgi:2-methylisocitrate lyase-like PEP mutase family enzyme